MLDCPSCPMRLPTGRWTLQTNKQNQCVSTKVELEAGSECNMHYPPCRIIEWEILEILKISSEYFRLWVWNPVGRTRRQCPSHATACSRNHNFSLLLPHSILSGSTMEKTHLMTMSCRDVDSWMSSISLHDDMVSWINHFDICMLDHWRPAEWQRPNLGNRIYTHIVCRAPSSWCFCRSNICKKGKNGILFIQSNRALKSMNFQLSRKEKQEQES